MVPKWQYKWVWFEDGLKFVEFDQEYQLDWKFKGSFTTFLNSNDIKVLRKYHGSDCCIVKSGYKFTESVPGE